MSRVNDYQEYLDELHDIRFRKELILDSDPLGRPIEREGLEALAQTVQNIILIEPGTYPNQPDLGVGISRYMFEILDDATINDIQDRINEQVEMFIPHPSIKIGIVVNKVSNKTNNTRINTVAIDITLENFINNTLIEATFLIASNRKTKKLVSKLYYS